MANDFIGDLSKARLFDVVRPLLNGKKSGMILIKGNDIGELHIEGGSVIHAASAYLTGEDALFAMMEWDRGRVTFDWEFTTEQRTVNMATDQLVTTCVEREEEWERIRQLIPSSNYVFRMRADGNAEDRSIPGDQWRVLALSSGTKTVAEIAHALKWDVFKTSKTICRMVEAGLLERVSEKAGAQKSSRRTVNGNFFPIIENELRKIMGPIAPIILEDKVAEFGESTDSFPEERLHPLVQAIGEEITDNAKRALFTRMMTEFLNQKQS